MRHWREGVLTIELLSEINHIQSPGGPTKQVFPPFPVLWLREVQHGQVSRVLPHWLAYRSAPSLQMDFPRLLHQLVSCCARLTGRRLVVWVRGGERSLSPHLSPVLLPTLFAERTGVLEPFSQPQLQILQNHPSTQSSSSTRGPCQHRSLSTPSDCPSRPQLPLHLSCLHIPALEWKQFLQLLDS